MKWAYITWKMNQTWKKDILPQLEKQGITEDQLDRAVYVIRTNGNFAIDYQVKPSPTLYIGEGNFKGRIGSHRRNWLNSLISLVGDFPIEIAVSIPRAKNNTYVYKDVEADLLWEFKFIYGNAPFFNKQNEYPLKEHEYINYDEFIKPLQIGRGKRIPWVIRPLKSNKFYKTFHQANE